MRDIDDLISGLIRAANDPARMAPEDHSGLLYQAILAITDLRRQAGIPPTERLAMASSSCGLSRDNRKILIHPSVLRPSWKRPT